MRLSPTLILKSRLPFSYPHDECGRSGRLATPT